MRLRFDPNQEYQLEAVDAVADLFDGMTNMTLTGGAHCLQEQCAWWRPPHVPLGATRDEVAGVCAILLIGRCIEHQAELASSAQKA